MSNERNFEGIRLAYVHLSVTTPRPSGRREVPAEATQATRDAGHRQWGRAARSRSSGRAIGLAA